jgi:hypothetical protein
LYEKVYKKDVPDFENGEKKIAKQHVKRHEPGKTFLELSSFGYNGEKALSQDQILKIAIKHGAEINNDADKMISFLNYTQYKGENKSSMQIVFESLENIKAKLDLIHEFGFMGAMVQSNSIGGVTHNAIGMAPWIMGIVVAVLSALIAPKPLAASSPFGKQIWIAIPAALGFSISGIFLLFDFFVGRGILSFVGAVVLLLSAIHLLLSETDRKLTPLGYFPPLACASLVCILYFDASMEMNAPLKVAVQCALLPLMLYFTAELRYLLGRELPRLFSALALGSLAVSSLCILTVPVASIMGTLNNAYCLIAAIAVIGINATVALRQWRYLQAPAPDTPSPDENDTKETDAQ